MRCFVLSCAIVAALAVAGCGKPTGQPTGKVTWKGAPVAGADIRFVPEGSPDSAAYGATSEEGTYHLDYRQAKGLPVGKCSVIVSRYVLANGKPLPGGEEGAALRAEEGKVKRESFQFEVDLPAGEKEFNFELSEGKAFLDLEE